MSPQRPSVLPSRAVPFAIAGKKRLPDFIARMLFGAPLAPSSEEWAEVQGALLEGDPPMDRVVAWMFEGDPGAAKALFEQALTRGIATLEAPPAPLTDFFSHIDSRPPWLDRKLLDQGAEVAQASGLVNFYVLRDIALMGGYAYFNSMNQTLAATGALQKDAGLRLGETGKWLDDVTRQGGLERFGDGLITTVRVRMVHALVRRTLLKRGNWDTRTWGLPINQIDMLATYLAFGPIALLGARMFGIPVRKQDARAAIHMWRYIGWLSGVQERWLANTEGDGLRKLYHTFFTHRLADDKVRSLGVALRDEPLTRRLPTLQRYPALAKLARFYLYHKHISNAALALGPRQRRRLGIPLWAVPWYPVLSAPCRFFVVSSYRLIGGKPLARLKARAAERQRKLLASYFGDREVSIIRPTADHPAHV